jgi:hypothetical protein
VTKGVTKAVTCTATPIKQLPCGRLRLRLELLPPTPESLERDVLSLAILSLIQIATLPRCMVSPPERLAAARSDPLPVRHPHILG